MPGLCPSGARRRVHNVANNRRQGWGAYDSTVPLYLKAKRRATRLPSRVWSSAIQFHYMEGVETPEGEGFAVRGEGKTGDSAGSFFASVTTIGGIGQKFTLGKRRNFDGAKFFTRGGVEEFDVGSTQR